MLFSLEFTRNSLLNNVVELCKMFISYTFTSEMVMGRHLHDNTHVNYERNKEFLQLRNRLSSAFTSCQDMGGKYQFDEETGAG